MHFSPILLSQRTQIERIRLKYGSKSSSHAFHSLYLWQEPFKLSVMLDDDFFAVKYEKPGSNCYFAPCGDPSKKLRFLEMLRKNGDFHLYYAQKEDVGWLIQNTPFPLRFRFDRNSSEYLYDIAEQCKLEGKHFAATRKKLHRVYANYQVTSRALDADTHNDACAIVTAWHTQKSDHSVESISEIDTDMRYLNHLDALYGKGVILYLNGVPSAVAAGVPLCDDIFDICLCKQINWAPGVNLCVRELLVRELEKQYKILNSEEDLGLPGLRIHKTEMHPVKMVNMWEVSYTNDTT